jgi:large subunit ribosomal protein L15
MKLNNIQASEGQRRNRKRLGCGIGTGHGKTGGRGHKGQKSRSGGGVMRGFEGGQMSLIRRLPKRGFTPLSRNTFQLINVGQLNSFEAGSTVDAAALYAAGLIRNAVDPVKLLASGDCEVKVTVSVAKTSATATAKVEKAGGSVAVSA